MEGEADFRQPFISGNQDDEGSKGDTTMFLFEDERDELKVKMVERSGDTNTNLDHCRCMVAGIDWTEAKQQAWLAGPMVYAMVVRYLMQLISIMIVGHLGELALSSAAVATSFGNVTGLSLLWGMACALDTLCGQAYGAKQYRKLGVYLQRAIFVLACTCVPVALIWANMESLLKAIGQDAQIAKEAGSYSRWLIINLFALAFSLPVLKFLQMQRIVTPMMFISTLTLIFHVPTCYLLVYKANLGNRGAALAIGISNWFNAFCLLTYVCFSKACSETRAPLSREAFHQLPAFFRLAIPSAMMICLEWWSYEILILMSGLLAHPELSSSVLSICLSITMLVYMIPTGLSAATSTRVSNELGAGQPKEARLAMQCSLWMALVEGGIVTVVLLCSRNWLGWAFSNEQEVVSYVASMVPLLATSTAVDNIQAVQSGVLRGAGRQQIGAYFNLASYYVVGLPIGYLLAFPLNMEGKGLWIGVTCGSITQLITYSCMIQALSWEKEASAAVARVGTQEALPIMARHNENDDATTTLVQS